MTLDTPMQTLDVTGLPESVVKSLQSQVDQFKANVTEVLPDGWNTPGVPCYLIKHNHTPEEFLRLLNELAALSSGQSLPEDFSRADIYDDHD